MAESIATLGIRITSQGVKDAERDLKGLAQAGEVAEKRASTLGKAWGLALGGAIAGGAALAVTGLKKWIANGIESEKVQAQLAARIKSTGAAAGLAVPQLNKMAAALQAATTFDDESIGRAQATLLTFTRVGRQNFERATEAVLDMSTALGTDLNSAALQVGKALNDPVQGLTALSRAGVQFSDSQKTTIKQLVETGRVADAQKIILRELETQMGGSARAARDTLGGALAALRNSFDNLLEGDAGGMRGARDAVENFNRALNDPQLKAGLDSAFTGMLNLASGAVQLIGKLGNAASALREFYGASSGKSLQSLQNRRTDLETELFGEQRAQRRSWLGSAAEENAPRVRALKAELAEIDRLIEARKKAARMDWVEGRVVSKPGTGRWADVTSEGPIKPPSLSADTSGASRRGAASRRALPDFLDQDRRDLAQLVAETARADDMFSQLAATLAGPLAAAEYQHQQNLREIDELGRRAGRTAADIGALKDAEAGRYRTQRTEIEAMLNPMRSLLESYEAEIDAMGRGNAERAVMNELRRQGISLASAEAVANLEAARALDEMARRKAEFIDLMDGFRQSGADAFTDFVTGAKSAKDAFRDFMDSIAEMITRAIAEKWISNLFGQMGSDGAGTSGGNLLGSLLGGLFGGGRAIGGPVSAGRVYQVNERGAPEIYTAGGKQFLLAPRDGRVTPATAAAGGRASQINQTFVVNGTPDRMTRQQMLRMAGSETSRAIRRG